MERDEFLKSLGLGLALVCTGSCMSGCGKGSDGPEKPSTNPPPAGGGGNGGGGGGGGTTASINMDTQVKGVGEQAVVNGVLFYRIAAGNAASSFVATESLCPHQNGNLVWKQSLNRVQCQLHFSEYSTGGAVLEGPQGSAGSTRALKIYSTAVSGTTLTATIS